MWPQDEQEVLMTKTPPHWQQWGGRGMVVDGRDIRELGLRVVCVMRVLSLDLETKEALKRSWRAKGVKESAQER